MTFSAKVIDGRPSVLKQNFQRTYQPSSPDQHAHFLRYISAIDININIMQANSTRSEFDNFYNIVAGLLNTFYPLRTITTTARDPAFITPPPHPPPPYKGRIRRKSKLMHAGRVQQVGALARRINKWITSITRGGLVLTTGCTTVL